MSGDYKPSTPSMPSAPSAPSAPSTESETSRLIAELEQAEAYEQRLRQLIVDVRDRLAAGDVSAALSMLNTALNDIDNATDVVASHPAR